MGRANGDPALVEECIELLKRAERPLLLSGSGVLWSGGAGELQAFVEAVGVPFYTTPQGRGAAPEDHPSFFGAARSTAFREADVVFVVGTRLSYVFGHGRAPRFRGLGEVRDDQHRGRRDRAQPAHRRRAGR